MYKIYAVLSLSCLLASCNKDYFKGIENIKNWRIEAMPSWGIAVLKGGMGYHDLIGYLPSEAKVEVDANHIVHLTTTQTLFSTYDDLFSLQELDISQSIDLPIAVPPGAIAGGYTYNLSIDELMGAKGLATLQAMYFKEGSITLSFDKDFSAHIGNISIVVGGISSQPFIRNTAGEVELKIPLDTLHPIVASGSTIPITMNISLATTLPAGSYGFSLQSEGLQLHRLVLSGVADVVIPIKATIKMDYLDKLNARLPLLEAKVSHPQLIARIENQSSLHPIVSNFKAEYSFYDGTVLQNNFQGITGTEPLQEESFDFGNSLSSLLSKAVLSTGLQLHSPYNVYPISIDSLHNIAISGKVDIPLVLHLKNAVYEDTLTLPTVSENILNVLDTAWIKTKITNSFPLRLKNAYIVAMTQEGIRTDSIAVDAILQSTDNIATVGLPKLFVKHLLTQTKGVLVIGMETIDDASGFATIRDTDTLQVKMGLGIRANGKEVINLIDN